MDILINVMIVIAGLIAITLALRIIFSLAIIVCGLIGTAKATKEIKKDFDDKEFWN